MKSFGGGFGISKILFFDFWLLKKDKAILDNTYGFLTGVDRPTYFSG
jgi:hypothetical protein